MIKRKKLLCWLVAVAMVIAMMPATVLAADNDKATKNEIENTKKATGVMISGVRITETELTAELRAKGATGTATFDSTDGVLMLTDFNLPETYNDEQGASVNNTGIEVSGGTVKIVFQGENAVKPGEGQGIWTTTDADIIFEGAKGDAEAKLAVCAYGDVLHTYDTGTATERANKIKMKSGEVNLLSAQTSKDTRNAIDSDQLIVDGGTLTARTELTIDTGDKNDAVHKTYKADCAVECDDDIIVNDGVFSTSVSGKRNASCYDVYEAGAALHSENGDVTVNEGIVNAQIWAIDKNSDTEGVEACSAGSAVVSGGKAEINDGLMNAESHKIGKIMVDEAVYAETVDVLGGTLNVDSQSGGIRIGIMNVEGGDTAVVSEGKTIGIFMDNELLPEDYGSATLTLDGEEAVLKVDADYRGIQTPEEEKDSEDNVISEAGVIDVRAGKLDVKADYERGIAAGGDMNVSGGNVDVESGFDLTYAGSGDEPGAIQVAKNLNVSDGDTCAIGGMVPVYVSGDITVTGGALKGEASDDLGFVGVGAFGTINVFENGSVSGSVGSPWIDLGDDMGGTYPTYAIAALDITTDNSFVTTPTEGKIGTVDAKIPMISQPVQAKTVYDVEDEDLREIQTEAVIEGSKDLVTNAPKLTVTKKGLGTVALKWTASVKKGSLTARNQYAIYRSTKAGSGFVPIKDTNSTQYTDKYLKAGTKYYYKVLPFNCYIEGEESNTASAVTDKVTVVTPKVEVSHHTKLKVSWSKADKATVYQLYRATSKNGSYKRVKTVLDGNTTSWVDQNLKMGKTYYYKVGAFAAENKIEYKGALSRAVSKKLTPCKMKITTSKNAKKHTVTVKLTKYACADGWQLAKSSNGDHFYVKNIAANKSKSYTYKNIKKGSTIHIKVRAYKNVDGKKVYGAWSDISTVNM